MYTAKYGIDDWEERHVTWRSITSGQEEGVLIHIDASDETIITFEAGPAKLNFSVGEVRSGDLRWELGGLEQVVTASTLHTDQNTLDTEFEYVDDNPAEGEQAYWVRVVQTDFHRAWSSPIYIEQQSEEYGQ